MIPSSGIPLTGGDPGQIRYMLDANICLYILKGLSEPAIKRLSQCEPGSVAISALCYAKFMMGRKETSAQEEEVLRAFFSAVPVIGFDQRAADAYAAMDYHRGRLDRMIGAHALSLHAVLVTNNERDFTDLKGLKTENWTL